ncbi:MAG: NAD(P)/FAD-dependent oxidoreductase [Lachnospiraceae bacterium]
MAEIVIIGGGAAGMMAAIAASDAGHHITLIEKNEKLGKKLFITGKGRCNVTNACETVDFFSNVLEHDKFLYSAVYGFDHNAVMDFFERAGCPLKVERGQRVFPKSDHSSDIIKALELTLREKKVEILLNTEVKKIITEPFEIENQTKKKHFCAKISRIITFDKMTKKSSEILANKLIIATGGCSYVLTGSTGDGYRFAKECGHSLVPTMPALVPFVIEETWSHQLQGLSLKNVQAVVEVDGKQIYSDFGELLFTHYGVSGPLILSASSYYVHKVCKEEKQYPKAKLFIDLKPALTKEQLDKRILREFDENKNKQFKNVISSLFPAKLTPIMPMLANIDPDKRINEVTKKERQHFVQTMKHMELTVAGLRDYNEAVITKGGVATKEVSPSTMESKLIKGLYFAGEVLDLDALTGGFNLQIAWSTGFLAGRSAASSA